jgi:hypothetical protein
MATEGLVGVGEESSALGKMTEPTSESSNSQHHGVELDEINSMVVSVCTGSPRLEFSKCQSSARVRGS